MEGVAMSADTEEKLDKKYAKLTKFLAEICDVAKGVDGELSTQEYLLNFDLLLQSLLLHQSKSNQAIYPKEQDFIDKVADKADILKIAKTQLLKDGEGQAVDKVEWDNIFDCPKEVFAKVDAKIQELTKEYTKNMVAYVALAEYLNGKNYFFKLNDETVDLLYYYAKLENGADENEVQQGIMGYIKFVANYYVEVMSNMEEFFANKNIKKELLGSLRKEYRENKRSNGFLERHLKKIKERLAGLFKKDKE
ncbi:MAG: hypothetical protein K2K85_02335 [Clostridia bacterium]|nr:hypothetical protein [Clostridia bacterium]